MIYPGAFSVTSPFGWRVLNGQNDNHKGIDVVGAESKMVCAVRSGVVGASQIIKDKSNRTWEWGNYVRIDGDDGMKYYYCHLDTRLVFAGQRVNKGDHIGIEGNTGSVSPMPISGSDKTSGRHCHFEVRNLSGWSVNPAPYLGIPNEVGKYGENLREMVQQRFGLSDVTMRFLDTHPSPSDLYLKLGTAE